MKMVIWKFTSPWTRLTKREIFSFQESNSLSSGSSFVSGISNISNGSSVSRTSSEVSSSSSTNGVDSKHHHNHHPHSSCTNGCLGAIPRTSSYSNSSHYRSKGQYSRVRIIQTVFNESSHNISPLFCRVALLICQIVYLQLKNFPYAVHHIIERPRQQILALDSSKYNHFYESFIWNLTKSIIDSIGQTQA